MISTMECIIEYLSWHKCSSSFIGWSIEVAKILSEKLQSISNKKNIHRIIGKKEGNNPTKRQYKNIQCMWTSLLLISESEKIMLLNLH